MTAALHNTVELAGIKLRLRDDLGISVREFGGEATYVIEDELASKFFRVGSAEYTFLSLLNGEATFADALGHTASVMKSDALSESEAASLCRWLVESGLASTDASRSSERLFEVKQKSTQKKVTRINPMFVKIPLFNPDSLMKGLAAALGWCFSAWMFPVWLTVIAIGGACVSQRWQEITSMTSTVISSHNWIWLSATLVAMKILHEAAHGITCSRFGATVREAGVTTILFVPLPYMDVTSAWRLDSRWQRIMVSAAGMYVEMFVAAVAAIVWMQTDPGLLHQHAFNVMGTGSLMTLLFNANPLMRFDGYYILTDLIEMPNLATHGQQCLHQLGRRIFFALPAPLKTWPEGRTWLVLAYGVGAFIWRILICVGMIMAADSMFFGAGVVLAVFAFVAWVLMPAFRLTKYVLCGDESESPSRARFGFVSSVLAGCLLLAMAAPWHEAARAPMVVDFDPVHEIRTGVRGFIDEVFVESGQSIVEGELLIQLSNPELLIQRHQLNQEYQKTQQQGRILHNEGNIAGWQVQSENAESMRQKLFQLDSQIAGLRIVAPCDGVVLDTDIASQTGIWLETGEQAVSIGPADSKQVLALVSENDIDAFRLQANSTVDIHFDGTGYQWQQGHLREPEPRASTEIVHPSFSSTAGGPLEVRVTSHTDANSSQQTLELLHPHFLVKVDADAEVLEQMPPGRTGVVCFRISRDTVGQYLGRSLRSWFMKRQRMLRQQTFAVAD